MPLRPCFIASGTDHEMAASLHPVYPESRVSVSRMTHECDHVGCHMHIRRGESYFNTMVNIRRDRAEGTVYSPARFCLLCLEKMTEELSCRDQC